MNSLFRRCGITARRLECRMLFVRGRDIGFVVGGKRRLNSNNSSNSSFRNVYVHEDAFVDSSAELHPYVVIHRGAKIGPHCVVEAGATIGEDVEIGAGTRIGARAVVTNCRIGQQCHVYSGVCIGQDGFGFIPGKDRHSKKPQTLRVIIGDEVEIGANCTIDRGSWRDTVIGYGSKLDNMVQVAHNVQIGKMCLIAAQAGIAGSTTIGEMCLIGGQVGIAQHLTIGDRVQIAAKSGVMTNVSSDCTIGGIPATAIRAFHRQTIALRKLGKKP